jgi:hypothetical protein
MLKTLTKSTAYWGRGVNSALDIALKFIHGRSVDTRGCSIIAETCAILLKTSSLEYKKMDSIAPGLSILLD